MNRIKAVILSGPTSIGKTDLSIELAKLLNAEIISADPIQAYKSLDIGSNKITKQEMQNIPHCLIDFLDFHYEYNVADFYDLCCQKLKEIHSRNRIAIVVGGTGFYLRWLLNGKPSTPAPDELKMKEIQSMLQSDGDWEKSLHRLSLFDSSYAQSLCRNDYYRLARALYITQTTGKKLKELVSESPLELDFRCFFLSRPRLELMRLVDYRCELMLQKGLLLEVAGLVDRGLSTDKPAGRAIGYNETIQLFDTLKRKLMNNPGMQPSDCVNEFDVYLAEFQKNTRNYARRQWQWFKNEEKFRWIPKGLDLESFKFDSLAELIASHVGLEEEEYEESCVLKEIDTAARLETLHDNSKIMRTFKTQMQALTSKESKIELLLSIWPWLNNTKCNE